MTELREHAGPIHEAAPDWRRVCRLDDLEVGWGEAALVDGEQVALFRLERGTVLAAAHRDPATGAGVMARGITGSRTVEGQERTTVASPLHKEVYDLRTGECLSGADLQLPTYPTRLNAGWLEIGRAA
ncbi:assimilatory nitrite reductase (NAD(P)H) small subunit [Raineyella antarctica]|uniref:Assimilatory nitrite reductase (NAD(P)H) small subunit n=1 Tax=Raineyella antarctica TaxID=1577474 RepID=A0A1G6GGH7_9ACTN|nr:nitrite reductase small subunit NirD [Raineyella antarctica]SDB80845.1 assimilatory nitrite reductase (NAD(P)H) small subunit [Raineyella antarctica]